MAPMNDTVRGVALTCAAAVVGSPTGLLVRLLDHSSAWTLLLFRALPNLAILFAAACWQYGGPRVVWSKVRGLGRLGVLAGACMCSQSVAIVVALLLTKTANVFLLIQTSPIVCAVVDRFVLHEPVGWGKLLFIFVGLAGVVTVVAGQHFVASDTDGDESSSDAKSGSAAMAGNFIALINPLSWAVYWMILRKSATNAAAAAAVAVTADTADNATTKKPPPKKYPLLALLLVAGCFHLALGLLVNAAGGFEDVTDTRAIDALYYVIFGALLVPAAQLLFSLGPRYVSTTTTACCKLVEVPLAPLWVFLLDGEVPAWTTLLGGAIIVVDIVVYAAAATRKKDPRERLGIACRNGDVTSARKAIDAGADVNAAVFAVDGSVGGTCTAAYVAAHYGHADVLNEGIGLTRGVEWNKGNTATEETPCHAACRNGHSKAFAMLLMKGADPLRTDHQGRTPIMCAEDPQARLGLACSAGDTAAARQALVDGADADAEVYNLFGVMSMGWDRTAVHVAAFLSMGDLRAQRKGTAPSAHILRDVLLPAPVSADPNKGNDTPLHTACESKHLDAIAALLEDERTDPNRFAKDGMTPCMRATYFTGYTVCLRALAEGAARQGRALNVNAVAPRGIYEGKTALDIALERNQEEAAAYLRDELGALRAADLPPPTKKPPKSAMKNQ